MPRYRNALPQLSGDMFLTDAGLETDLIFNHGVELREFRWLLWIRPAACHGDCEGTWNSLIMTNVRNGSKTDIRGDLGTKRNFENMLVVAHKSWIKA